MKQHQDKIERLVRKQHENEIKRLARERARAESIPLIYWVIPWSISLLAIVISLIVIITR